MELQQVKELADKIRNNTGQVIVGKDEVVDLLLVALIASGHVLLEDVPGTGKTLIAKTLAKSIDSTFRRVQFTPDLLPSDVSGINYYNQKIGEFQFRSGPLFTNILLADEINRATPRTQSSLLESMEERQVTIDGETHVLARPFLVLATQNPVENQGTYPLPEAQLDRFLLMVQMGYPSHAEGLQVLRRFQSDNPFTEIEPVCTAEDIVAAQDVYTSVHVSDEVLEYLLSVAERTRAHRDVTLGVSPRGSQALLRAAQAYAAIQGRTYVTPDDIQWLALPVLGHRLVLRQRRFQAGSSASASSEASESQSRHPAAQVIREVLSEVPVPTEPELSNAASNAASNVAAKR